MLWESRSVMFTVRPFALCLSVLVFALSGCGASAARIASAETTAGAASGESQAAELSGAEVLQHLRGNETDLRRCFLANPRKRGALRFSWRLDVTGRVHGIRREASTLGDPAVEACIRERLSEIRFGDLKQPAIARWTFVFRLVDPPKAALARASVKSRRAPSKDERGLVIDPNSEGDLPADAIDNVVEAGYPLFARCYRDGISRSNDLGGTVRLHFVVGPAGTVSEVSDGGSDLSDRQVVDCIAEGFYALRFPEPQHGTVHVLYRIGFEAG
jgi:hypothetical protein